MKRTKKNKYNDSKEQSLIFVWDVPAFEWSIPLFVWEVPTFEWNMPLFLWQQTK